MRKHFFTLIAILSLASCKEIGPSVILTAPSGPLTDTTYMSGVQAKQPRMVLIEEFTGVSCPPCPNGHRKIKSLEDQYPGRIAVVGIQPLNWIQANPVKESGVVITKHDNRTQEGTDLAKVLGSLTSTPSAYIDRDSGNTGFYYSLTDWDAAVDRRIAVPTQANLELKCVKNDTGAGYKISVKASYTETMTSKQFLTIVLVEDSVIDAQEDGLQVEENYEHEHVLRDVITSPVKGEAIMTKLAAIEAGRVYERFLVYTPDVAWNTKYCRLIAYLSQEGGTSRTIVQAAQIHLP